MSNSTTLSQLPHDNGFNTFMRERIIFGLFATYVGRGFGAEVLHHGRLFRAIFIIVSLCSMLASVIQYNMDPSRHTSVEYIIFRGGITLILPAFMIFLYLRNPTYWPDPVYTFLVTSLGMIFLGWRLCFLSLNNRFECLFGVDIFLFWVAISHQDILVQLHLTQGHVTLAWNAVVDRLFQVVGGIIAFYFQVVYREQRG